MALPELFARTWPWVEVRYDRSLGRVRQWFADLAATLAHSDQYEEAKELLSQAERLMPRSYEELLRKVGRRCFRRAQAR